MSGRRVKAFSDFGMLGRTSVFCLSKHGVFGLELGW